MITAELKRNYFRNLISNEQSRVCSPKGSFADGAEPCGRIGAPVAAGIGVGIVLFEAHSMPQLEPKVNASIESCLVKSFHFVFGHFDYISTRRFRVIS